jgi:protein-disulfide isomerase
MPAELTLAVGPRDHIRGHASAAVTLVEYGDFECPQCAAARPIVARVAETFGDRLRVVFRHFPLTNSHPSAQHAAEEAEWAAARRAFWPMHDALYGAQKSLSDRRMVELAVALGLPGAAAALGRAWAEHTFIPRVKEDFASGLKSGVTGTPAFFINGVRHEGGWDEIALSHAIEAALK